MTVPDIGPHSSLVKKMIRRLNEKEAVFKGHDISASDIPEKDFQYSILNDEMYDADINCSVYSHADSVKSASHRFSAPLAQRVSDASKESLWGTY